MPYEIRTTALPALPALRCREIERQSARATPRSFRRQQRYNDSDMMVRGRALLPRHSSNAFSSSLYGNNLSQNNNTLPAPLSQKPNKALATLSDTPRESLTLPPMPYAETTKSEVCDARSNISYMTQTADTDHIIATFLNPPDVVNLSMVNRELNAVVNKRVAADSLLRDKISRGRKAVIEAKRDRDEDNANGGVDSGGGLTSSAGHGDNDSFDDVENSNIDNQANVDDSNQDGKGISLLELSKSEIEQLKTDSRKALLHFKRIDHMLIDGKDYKAEIGDVELDILFHLLNDFLDELDRRSVHYLSIRNTSVTHVDVAVLKNVGTLAIFDNKKLERLNAEHVKMLSIHQGNDSLKILNAGCRLEEFTIYKNETLENVDLSECKGLSYIELSSHDVRSLLLPRMSEDQKKVTPPETQHVSMSIDSGRSCSAEELLRKSDEAFMKRQQEGRKAEMDNSNNNDNSVSRYGLARKSFVSELASKTSGTPGYSFI